MPHVNAEDLMGQFNAELDGSIRQAILIGLGSGYSNLSVEERKRHAQQLLELFESDPDPGVHGAAEWVLRKWGFEDKVARSLEKLSGKPRNRKRWFVTSKLHTMIVIPAPGRFRIGSPADELRARRERAAARGRDRLPHSR